MMMKVTNHKNYYIKVKELMDLPRPRRRLYDIDGSRLPLILLRTGEDR